jgi:lipopolysaccharide assembly outer membrane protein LptD (OstA)
MKTYIEDDVLFTQKELNELELILALGMLEVYEDSVFISALNVHYDEEMEFVYVDEGIEYSDKDVRFVYINNEVVYLSALEYENQDD